MPPNGMYTLQGGPAKGSPLHIRSIRNRAESVAPLNTVKQGHLSTDSHASGVKNASLQSGSDILIKLSITVRELQ